MPHSQPTALQQTVCKFHLDPQYHTYTMYIPLGVYHTGRFNAMPNKRPPLRHPPKVLNQCWLSVRSCGIYQRTLSEEIFKRHALNEFESCQLKITTSFPGSNKFNALREYLIKSTHGMVMFPVIFDLRSAQVYCVAIFLVSQEVSLNFHRCCG